MLSCRRTVGTGETVSRTRAGSANPRGGHPCRGPGRPTARGRGPGGRAAGQHAPGASPRGIQMPLCSTTGGPRAQGLTHQAPERNPKGPPRTRAQLGQAEGRTSSRDTRPLRHRLQASGPRVRRRAAQPCTPLSWPRPSLSPAPSLEPRPPRVPCCFPFDGCDR